MRRSTRSRSSTSAIVRPMPKRWARRRSFLMRRAWSFRLELLWGKLSARARNAAGARDGGGALQVAAGARIAPVDPQRFREIRDGARRVRLAKERLAAAVEGPRQRRVGFDRA